MWPFIWIICSHLRSVMTNPIQDSIECMGELALGLNVTWLEELLENK